MGCISSASSLTERKACNIFFPTDSVFAFFSSEKKVLRSQSNNTYCVHRQRFKIEKCCPHGIYWNHGNKKEKFST